tara:strand:- start:3072 stop:4988 length:1917 start_codon:yes stop_codon:yes gene_type:complete
MRWLYIIVCFLGVKSFSQVSSEFKKYKEENPNSHSVRLNQETTVTIALDNGDFVITQETVEEDLFLDETATSNSKQSLSFSSFFEMEDIEASAYILRNGKYEEHKVQDYKEKDELNDSFYDDSKTLSFIYPNLQPGAKAKLRYTQKIKNPRFLNPFFFASFYPIINNKYTLIVDKNVELVFREQNFKDFPIIYTKSENRKNNIYTWQIKNIGEFDYEENAPSYKSVLPHIIPMISAYKVEGVRKNILTDVADLYAWYYSLVEKVNKDPVDKDLVLLVQSLTKDKANDLEKVRAIYYWTQENIKYIAFEYALGGFIPREANEVFTKKYGDCKDNSSILYRMLEIAGIQGHLTWIGTRSIPYSYHQVPTPIVDNHMILAYEFEGKTYYLDATGRFTPIEMPTSFIQGKEALLSFGKDSFEIRKVPIVAPEQNSFREQSVITLNGSNIEGSSSVDISGYIKIDYFYELEREKSDSKIKAFYNATFQKGNNSFLIDNLTETNKFDYDKNLLVNYDFIISNYAKALGDEIYVNLNLNKKTLVLKSKENRKMAVEFDYMDFYEYQTILTIPEGYGVDYLPENIVISNDYLACEIRYELVDNQIIYRHSITLKTINLDLEAQKKMNELISKIDKEYKEVVVLQKK